MNTLISQHTSEIEPQKMNILEEMFMFFMNSVHVLEQNMRTKFDYFQWIQAEQKEVDTAYSDENYREEIGDYIMMQMRFFLGKNAQNANSLTLAGFLQNSDISMLINTLSFEDLSHTRDKFISRYAFIKNQKIVSHIQTLDPEIGKFTIETLYAWEKSQEPNRKKYPKFPLEMFDVSSISIPEGLHAYFLGILSVLYDSTKNLSKSFCLGVLLFCGIDSFQEIVGKVFSTEKDHAFAKAFFDPKNEIDVNFYILFFEYKELFDFSSLSIHEVDLLFVQIRLLSRVDGIAISDILNGITRNPIHGKVDVYVELFLRVQQIAKTSTVQRKETHRNFLQAMEQI